MKGYVFIIASIEDVGDIDLTELVDLYNQDHQDVYSYDFQVPECCGDDVATLIGKGHAFNAGWNPEACIGVALPTWD